MLRGGVGYTNGCNSPFQNLASALAKSALWSITRECYRAPESPLYGSRPVLLMHDEIIAEVPIYRAHEAADRLALAMIEAGFKWLPDLPVEAEPWLCSYWTKDAETRRDASGRLIEWRP
jgi:DNA polymerase I-like protein with 3'-5' exonuclease and polymerase domains